MAAYLVIQEQGTTNAILLWHDPKAEDPDNKRFVYEMAQYLGMTVTQRSDGRSPWELFEDEKFLGNNRVPICSRILKREQGMKYIKEELQNEEFILYFGYSIEEGSRVSKTSQLYGIQGIKTAYPLFEHRLTKDDAWNWLLKTGIKPPVIYQTLGPRQLCRLRSRGTWALVGSLEAPPN